MAVRAGDDDTASDRPSGANDTPEAGTVCRTNKRLPSRTRETRTVPSLDASCDPRPVARDGRVGDGAPMDDRRLIGCRVEAFQMPTCPPEAGAAVFLDRSKPAATTGPEPAWSSRPPTTTVPFVVPAAKVLPSGAYATTVTGAPTLTTATKPGLGQRAAENGLRPPRGFEVRRVERPGETLLGIDLELDQRARRQFVCLSDPRTISRLSALVHGEDRDRRHDEQTDEGDRHQRERATVAPASALDPPLRLVPQAPREDGVAEDIVIDLVAERCRRRPRPLRSAAGFAPRRAASRPGAAPLGRRRRIPRGRRPRARSSLPTA